MNWRLLARLLIAGSAALPALLTHAAPQAPSARRGAAGDLPPCFRTEVPAHPYDIILGRPTDRSVAASVLSYAKAEGYIEWGRASGEYPNRTATVELAAGEPATLFLQELTPDTQFFYRFRSRTGQGEFGAGEEHRFHTQRPPGSPFTFTIQADSHLDERTTIDLYATTLRNALADNPDFHIDLGDTFMGDKVRALGQPLAPMYLAQRYYLGLLCPCAPLYFVIGNHDGEIAAQDPQARALRLKYLPNPSPDGVYSGNEAAPLGNYYAWTWGDALFIVLDPFTYSAGRIRTADDNWNRTLGQTQYEWLKRTLETSHAASKFVFIHHLVGGLDKNARGGVEAAPYFEWGGRSLDGAYRFDAMRPGWGLPIHQLLAKHGVSAVFHGHDHFYARQELDGVVYQEVPQPGWVGGETVNQAAEYGYKSGDIVASSGHLRVLVSPVGARVDYIRSRLPGAGQNAATARTYMIPARG
jgi:hypothetical protein